MLFLILLLSLAHTHHVTALALLLTLTQRCTNNYFPLPPIRPLLNCPLTSLHLHIWSYHYACRLSSSNIAPPIHSLPPLRDPANSVFPIRVIPSFSILYDIRLIGAVIAIAIAQLSTETRLPKQRRPDSRAATYCGWIGFSCTGKEHNLSLQ